MNKVIKILGTVVVAAAAFGLIACDDSSSSPSAPNSDPGVQEQQNSGDLSSSGTALPPASSDANQLQSSSETVQQSSSSDTTLLPESSSDNAGENSSSSVVVESSSSEILSSSSDIVETCMDIAPTPCRGLEEGCGYRLCDPNGPQEATDCGNKKVYVCENGMWELKYGVETCPPGGDCDGDGIPDGVRRLDLEPCEDGADPLEFYGRSYVCQDNKWVYAPAPDYDDDSEIATDVSAMHRGGPAVAPRVVKVLNSNGTVTFRDDDVFVNDRCTFTGLKAKISNDTLYAVLLYPECSETGGSMGVATFTLSETFAGAKYIKYKDGWYVHEIYETDELLPCGNTSSCQTCAEGLDCGGRVF